MEKLVGKYRTMVGLFLTCILYHTALLCHLSCVPICFLYAFFLLVYFVYRTSSHFEIFVLFINISFVVFVCDFVFWKI